MIEARYVLFLAGTLVGAIMLQRSACALIKHYVSKELQEDEIMVSWYELIIALAIMMYIVVVAILFEQDAPPLDE